MSHHGKEKPDVAVHSLSVLLGVMIQLGFTCFGGGWSIIAQMEENFVRKRGWITEEELTNIVSLARGLPGVMIMNVSVLFGYQTAGPAGAFLAAFGCALPSLLVIFVVSMAYQFFSENPYVMKAMIGVRAAVVAVTGSVCVKMWKIAIRGWRTVAVMVVVFLLCWTSVSKAVLILSAICVGVADFLIGRRKRS